MKLVGKLRFKNWKKYLFEFLSVFFAVTFAFVLDGWREDKKDQVSESKILTEIYKGLERDSLDLVGDEAYFKITANGIKYFNKLIDGETVQNDSLVTFYFFMTRDVIVVQNKSGYESLKSIGLETIKDDSLRTKIIDLYEVSYELSRKFNEEHQDYKFMQNYFFEINNAFAPNFQYNASGNISGIDLPLEIEEKQRKLLKSYFWKITVNKNDRYQANQYMRIKIGDLRRSIKEYLKEGSK